MVYDNSFSYTKDINDLRLETLSIEIGTGIGKRILILTSEYPFLIIGRIVGVEGQFVYINAETTNVDEFEGNVIRTHIVRIMVFHIETAKYPIPRILPECAKDRGEII